MSNQRENFENAAVFIEAHRIFKRYTITGRGEFQKSNGDLIDETDFLAEVVLANAEQIRDFRHKNQMNLKAPPESHFRHAIQLMVSQKRQESFDLIRESIKFKGVENISLPKQWLRAVVGDFSALDLAVFCHFIANVKRKSQNKKAYKHIMLNLYGKQGAGKTEALRALFGPLKEMFTCKTDLSAFSKDKDLQAMFESLVCMFDELGGAKKQEMSTMKNVISADVVSLAMLFRNGNKTFRNKASFISAANKPLNTVFFDSTGMRRFYELRTLSKIDWDGVNSIDYQALWEGIDENKNYLAGYEDELDAWQKKNLVTPDQFDLFIEEYGFVKSTGDEEASDYIKANDLYEEYRVWAKANEFPICSHNKFPNELAARGISKESRTSSGYSYKVKTGHNFPIRINATVTSITGAKPA